METKLFLLFTITSNVKGTTPKCLNVTLENIEKVVEGTFNHNENHHLNGKCRNWIDNCPNGWKQFEGHCILLSEMENLNRSVAAEFCKSKNQKSHLISLTTKKKVELLEAIMGAPKVSEYILFDERKTRDQAERQCNERNAHLVSIWNEQENFRVAGLVQPDAKNGECAVMDMCAWNNHQVCKLPESYTGNKSTTKNGIPCRKWRETDTVPDEYHNNNKCRNPDNDAPWCYTTDPNVTWDYCFHPCGQWRQDPSLDSCVINEMCAWNGQQVCKNNNISTWGKSTTVSGKTCAHRYDYGDDRCRNSDNDVGPWCFINYANRSWERCYPQCGLKREYQEVGSVESEFWTDGSEQRYRNWESKDCVAINDGEILLDGHTFFHSTSSKTWKEAMVECAKHDGLKILTDEEGHQLMTKASRPLWIALKLNRSSGLLEWRGNSGERFGYENKDYLKWKEVKTTCAAIDTSKNNRSEWVETDCSETHRFVCKKKREEIFKFHKGFHKIWIGITRGKKYWDNGEKYDEQQSLWKPDNKMKKEIKSNKCVMATKEGSNDHCRQKDDSPWPWCYKEETPDQWDYCGGTLKLCDFKTDQELYLILTYVNNSNSHNRKWIPQYLTRQGQVARINSANDQWENQKFKLQETDRFRYFRISPSSEPKSVLSLSLGKSPIGVEFTRNYRRRGIYGRLSLFTINRFRFTSGFLPGYLEAETYDGTNTRISLKSKASRNSVWFLVPYVP